MDVQRMRVLAMNVVEFFRISTLRTDISEDVAKLILGGISHRQKAEIRTRTFHFSPLFR